METKTQTKTVVVDIHIPQLLNNRLFNREEALGIHHTLEPLLHFFDLAKQSGYQLVTPDVYLKTPQGFPGAVLISHLTSSFTPKVIAAGAVPLLLWCQESPFIATGFYLKFRAISKQFNRALVFPGMKRQLYGKTAFVPGYFPVPYEVKNFSPLPFAEKKFACLVSGAKFQSNALKTMLLKLLYGFSVRNINILRAEIVETGSHYEGFDLFGVGWDKAGIKAVTPEAVRRRYRGSLPAGGKFEVTAKYKFNFCPENSVFPGYVTEKIFDAFAAGSVPVYKGAPDIEHYVPKNCFVDIRDFKDLTELFLYLSTMPESVYNNYINNIRFFLASPQFKLFTQGYFSNQLLAVLNQHFHGQS